jgi:hypothetical protein
LCKLASHSVALTLMFDWKQYVKGFILDRLLVAKLVGVESISDPEVDTYIRIIIDGLNRDGHQFIAAVHEHTTPGQQPMGVTWHWPLSWIMDATRKS